MANPNGRVRRSSINGTRQRLAVRGKEPGFQYRIVNDVEDRVQTLKEIGYEIVTDKNVQVGDKRVSNPTQEGSPVQISVGAGQKAYLMRQKDEYFQEDQKAKANKIDEMEASMKKEAQRNGFYGKLNISIEKE